MAHDHAHHHGDANSYYLEQLFTIAVCGALGAVMVMLYVTDRIQLSVGRQSEQHTRVLLGGAGLLAVALVRAIYVWFAVGANNRPHMRTITNTRTALATMTTALATMTITNTTTITNTSTPSKPPPRRQ